MTISEMHLLYKLSLDKVGNNALPYFEPEAIDMIINYAIKAVVKQKISGNNALRQGAEETTKRKSDLQTLLSNYEVPSSLFEYTSDNKPFGAFIPMKDDIFYILDEEVNIGSYLCNTNITSGNIKAGQLYKISSGVINYNGVAYSPGGDNIFMGINGITTFQLLSSPDYGSTINMVKRVNVLPIRNDQYNTLVLDPFNRPDENRILKLEYGKINDILYIELISSKDIEINKYYLRYYKTPITVNYGANISCDLPDIIHEEIIDFAVNWTLENIESQRFQSQIANTNRNE